MRRLLLILLFVWPAAAQVPVPHLQVEASAVTVTQVTPGGRVAIFGVIRDSDGYISALRRVAEMRTDDDHDGVVTLPSDRPISASSIWVAVDVTSGSCGVGLGASDAAQVLRKAKHFATPDGTHRDEVSVRAPLLEAVYAVPDGAWTRSVAAGSRGSAAARLGDFTAIGDSGAPPAAFTAGGTLVLIDAFAMTYDVATLDDATLAGGQ